MTIQATNRKIKRSFTLTPASVEFVAAVREKRKARSDSEALDLLLHELMLEGKRQEIDAAYKEYYDAASDEELAEQQEWAEMAGPNILIDLDKPEAQA
jgi:hypothetical protein